MGDCHQKSDVVEDDDARGAPIKSPPNGPKARQIDLRAQFAEDCERHFVSLERGLPGLTIPLAIRLAELEELDTERGRDRRHSTEGTTGNVSLSVDELQRQIDRLDGSLG